jgi:uncharacterized protein YkwD
MKKIITLIVFMFSFLGMSQKIENGVINFKILEAEVIKQVNQYRKKLGLDSLHTSKSVYTEIASKHMDIIVKADLSFHPDIDVSDETVNMKIYLERCSTLKEQPNTTYIQILKYGENLCTLTGGISNTYQEFANRIVQSWIDSPPHKEIMESDYTLYGYNGLIACSVRKSVSNKYYVLIDLLNLAAF